MERRESARAKPVFVGGVPRSGTSLVQKMLDLHSEVYGGPELSILPPLMATYRQLRASIRNGKLSMVLDEERARQSYRAFFWSLYEDRLGQHPYRYLSEKTPLNLVVFDLLAEVFPDARFVWVVRDPRDVLCSMRAVRERSRQRGAGVALGRPIHEELRSMRAYLESGESFRRAHGERLHVVHYEDVLADARAAAGALCDFLDLALEPQMLATEQSNDTSAALGENRKVQSVFYDLAMFDRPIDVANAGKWRVQLDTASVRAVQRHLGDGTLPCLTSYDIGKSSRAWTALFAVVEPTMEIARAAARRLRR